MGLRYKILSIDGGGIKGLYSAVILDQFEKKYGPIHQHFNLICGTSTGGIIALALALGIPASEIVKFYTEKGPKIFPYVTPWSRKFHEWKAVLCLSKYKNNQLRAALEEVFQDKKIKDCLSDVLIPSVNITSGKPYVFKSDYIPRYTRDSERLLVEVSLATSAAPTYFPIVNLNTKNDGLQQFVDGGLFANNPSLYGIQEFLANKEEIGFSNYMLLSISSLHEGTSIPLVNKLRKPFFGWKEQLISLMIDSQSMATHFHIEYLRKFAGGEYIRIPSAVLVDSERAIISLDLAHKKSISLMVEKGQQMASKWIDQDDVTQFFNNKTEEASA